MYFRLDGTSPSFGNETSKPLTKEAIKLRLKQQKPNTVFNADGSRTERTLGGLTTYKDVNGDGKEDIFSVTNTRHTKDGGRIETTYIDVDGDGYNDKTVTREYDTNGKLKKETTNIEEDINDVKKRDHMPWEEFNRRMTSHKSGTRAH